MDAEYWIRKLGLTEHPEGGYFAPAYRSRELLDKGCLPERFPGARAVVSSIHYLLVKGQFSAFHRIKSVEFWQFCTGSPLILHVLDKEGNLAEVRLGGNPEQGELFQRVVEPGCWFGAEVSGPDGYSLVNCIVAPGFDFEDFELARREELVSLHPRHRMAIERLTRS